MAPLSLKIILENGAVTRTVMFDSGTKVADAYNTIKEKVLNTDDGKEYALFLTSADNDRSGIWLEPHRPLDYYMLRNGDSLLYLHKQRNLRVKMLDGTVKTLQVDESKNIGDLMMVICGKIGITNHDEYGLCQEDMDVEVSKDKENRPTTGTLTLKRKKQERERDAKMDQLSKKLKTDDNVDWLDTHRTLREVGVDPTETLLLKRRLFYSDRNVDSRDPVQLNLLYVQTRDAILNGRHPVTEAQAMEFAAIQCQIHFGDFQEEKHKPGLIENLKEYLPEQYSSSWGAEKKILKLYRKHQGLSHLEAKHLYTKTARDLPTYGVTFFVVKEKQKGKMKMVPRLLGINSESILRLDEVTKEILQVWPLTHVMTYHAGKNDTFTLNFGDYSEKEYSVKTNDAYRIRDILEGYIDIIRKSLCGPGSGKFDEGGVVAQECVMSGRGQEMTHVAHSSSKVVEHSFVGPTKILPFEQGCQATTGTQMMTVQQVIVANKGSTKQQVLSGEVPMRSDMSQELVKKLNRMNANAVKIVTLLTEPTDDNIQLARSIYNIMEENMSFIQTGVKEAAEKQNSEEAKKKLLIQLEELNALVAGSCQKVKSNDMNPEEVQEQARQIADLTTQMYFSLDPRTKRRSEFCRRSRQSFIEDEKTNETLRRASFIHAAAGASQALENADNILAKEYQGPPLRGLTLEQLEATAVDKLGKLNAAVALHLIAHSDPKNVDYETAVNSMNTLKELLPELATDAQAISQAISRGLVSYSTGENDFYEYSGDVSEQIMDNIRALMEAVRAGGLLTGCEENQKIQAAAHNFADVSGKLVYIFGARNKRVNADKENEIMELARLVGDSCTQLLVNANDLTEQSAQDPASQVLDTAGVECADAARHLLATVQLTSPTIHEPHCRSALTASCENLSAAAQRLTLAWKPLVENPPRPREADLLANGTMELAKALDRLKNAYANLPNFDEQQGVIPEQAKKLRFIDTINTSRAAMLNAQQELDKPLNLSTLSDNEMNELQDRIYQKLAQNNAAVASLLQAKSDQQNPDYDTADTAICTISEVTPEIVKDARAVLSSCPDERARRAMLADFWIYCQGASEVCASAEADDPKDLEEATKRFAKCSKKLSFAFSPHARKAREQLMMELFSSAHKEAMQMVDDTNKMADALGGANAEKLRDLGKDVQDSARNLQTTLMVTSPSLDSDRCRSVLLSSSTHLSQAAQRLTSEVTELQDAQTGCRVLSAKRQQQQANIAKHADVLQRALAAIRRTLEDTTEHTEVAESPKQKVNRLKFIASASAVQQRAKKVELLIEKPVEHGKLNEEQVKQLESKRARELAAVNAAIALLINAKNDRNNPNYSAAEEAIETVSELMPEIINDTKTLSSTCAGKEYARILADTRAWCDAIQAVCVSAGDHDLTEFVDSAQHFANTSDKLKFMFTPRKATPEEKQVMQLTEAACSTAKEMVSESHAAVDTMPAVIAADICVKAKHLDDAANALKTTAQLTATSLQDPNSRAALLTSSECVRDTAGALVNHCGEHTDLRCKDLGTQLSKKKDVLDKALDGIKDTCGSEGSNVVENSSKKAQRLKFVAGISAVNNKLDAIDNLLDQPTLGVKLTDQQAKDVKEKLSQDVARVHAAIASLLQAKSDVNNPYYVLAEQSIEAIAELIPAVAKETKALSTACKDEKQRTAMIQDMHAWCDDIRDVVASAGNDDLKKLNEAVKKLGTTTGKMKFIVSSCRNPMKESEIIRAANEVQTRALQMATKAERIAQTIPGVESDEIKTRAQTLKQAALALDTTAKLTAPSIHEPTSQASVISSLEDVKAASKELVTYSLKANEPAIQLLGTNLQAMDRQLNDETSAFNYVCTNKKPSPGTLNKQQLKFVTSADAAKMKIMEVKKQVLCLYTPGAEITGQQAKHVQENLAQDVARVHAAVTSLLQSMSDAQNPDYILAEKSIEEILKLVPAVAKETNSLSTACPDKEQRTAMIQDMQAWCDAIIGVIASAENGDHKQLDVAVQRLGSASGKMTFIVSCRRNPMKESEVVQAANEVASHALQMAAEAERIALTVPGIESNEIKTRAQTLKQAALALDTTAKLTSQSIHEPTSQASVISSLEDVKAASKELVTYSLKANDPAIQLLGTKLQAMDRQLNNKTSTFNYVCTNRKLSPDMLKKQQLQFITIANAAEKKVKEVEKLLDQPTLGVKLTDQQAKDVQENLAQDVARVHAAIASILQAMSGVQNPDYVVAEKSIEEILETLPAVATETKALSTAYKDEKQRIAMIREMRAWCDDIRRVIATAENGDHKKLDEAVLKLGNATDKMKFVVSCRRNPMKESEVVQAANEVSSHALQMAAEAERIAQTIPGVESNEIKTRAQTLKQAAQALETTAKLTAPSIHEPTSQASLLSSLESVTTASKELVTYALQTEDPALQLMGAELQVRDKQLDDFSMEFNDVCTNKKILPGTLQKQKLKFVTSANTAEKKAKEVEKLLDQPPTDIQLSDQGNKDLQEKLSKAMAQVNAALASIVNAKSDQRQPNYVEAEKSFATISELLPEIVTDAKDLSVNCKDAETSRAIIEDIRAWCAAINTVCASAASEQNKDFYDATLQFSKASQKLRFVNSARKNPVKEQQIMQLSSSACDKAKQMADETRRTASVVKGTEADLLINHADSLTEAAVALHTTAQLTAPTIDEPQCQAVLLSSADTLSSSAQVLVRDTAKAQHPAARRLSEEVDRYRDIMDRALNNLKTAVVAEDRRTGARGPPPPLPVKRSSLHKSSTSGASGDRRSSGASGASVPQSPRVHLVSHSDTRRASQEWLNHMREDATKDNEASIPKGGLTKHDIAELDKKADEEKLKKETFDKTADNAEETIHEAEQVLNKALSTTAGEYVLDDEQKQAMRRQLELKLANANNTAAALVSIKHPDGICYDSATEATKTLSDLIPDIVKDGILLSNSEDEKPKRALLDRIRALCEASKRLVKSRNNNQEVNEAAVEFGNCSAGLLYVITVEVDPAQEKGVIERARAIGDVSSMLAEGAAGVAAKAGAPHTLRICDAGRAAADAARTLVYTAKLVAPTVHHQQSQNALITASHELSTQLRSFSNTWKPLVSDPKFSKPIAEMTEEANTLEKLLEGFRKDLAGGKLVKRREVEKIIIEDTGFRRLAAQIMELAQMQAATEKSTENKKKFSEYAGSLKRAIYALDVANSRCKRKPKDLTKYQDLEDAVLQLQMQVLQARPCIGEQGQNNVVDLTDFVKDASKKAEKLMEVANKTKAGKENKENLDSIKSECHKINLEAFRLLNPDTRQDGDETSLDGYLDIDQFGQDCDSRVQNMKSLINGLKDKDVKHPLSHKLMGLDENCHYLRFATKCALATAQSASLNETLDDLIELEKRVDKMLVPAESGQPTKVTDEASLWKAQARVIRAASSVAREATLMPAAISSYITEIRARTDLQDTHQRNKTKEHISKVLALLKQLTATASTLVATWQPVQSPQVAEIIEHLIKELESQATTAVATDDSEKSQFTLKDVDLNRVLMPNDVKIEGEPKKIEEKLQQSASKLVMLMDTLTQGATQSESNMARTAPAITSAALQLAASARSLPAQSSSQAKRTEEAAQEMCWATYNLLKAAQLVSRDSTKMGSRNRLRSASNTLSEAINKLARVSCTGNKFDVECAEQTRSLKTALARTQPAPCSVQMQDCIQGLSGQREVLQKVNSDEPMSRAEFSKSLSFITAAVCNSTEFAAQSAYLIQLSEHNKDLTKEGLVDVPRLQKLTSAMQESCYFILRTNQVDSAKEEETNLSRLNQELQQAVKEASAKTKDGTTKRELTERAFKTDVACKALGDAVTASNACMDKITAHTLTVVDCVGSLSNTLDRPTLLPQVGEISAETKAMSDDIVQHSKTLINKTQALLKDVKNTDEDVDPMTWVTYNTHRKSIIDAFEALLNRVRQNGERSGLVEVVKEAEEEPEGPTKSFIQIQEETARKWLQRRPSDSRVRDAGETAANAIIDVAQSMTEDMKGSEKEELLHVISESHELVAECSKKYDNDKASLLMEHLRELRRAIQRGAVTCLVEDCLQEEPLRDLEIFLDAERDEAKRKFLLEKKIAELMSQLGRTTRTARLVSRAGQPNTELDKCREQTELLAPKLVAAAQTRVSRPEDARAVSEYRALLAEYAAGLARVRELCDRAVDPLDFVQTAGETMARMREESTQHGDPMKCAYTSKAITRLANRVISVSMSSEVARADPELRAALTEAQDKLTATVPAPGTRESRLPDWKDTTAEILRTTGEVESALGGENIFKKLPVPDQPIYNAALSLHSAVRGWSARDNEIVAVAKRMAVLMARLSEQMNTARRKESVTRKPWIEPFIKEPEIDKEAEDRKRELIVTSKAIVKESTEVAALAKKLANECADVRIKMNLLQVCERIPTISGQLKMLTVVKGSTLGNQGGEEDREAMNMLVTNAQNLMSSVQEVVKAAASASVKIASQRGLKWVRKNY